MAYNSTQNLLDFDDDMFLNPSPGVTITPNDISANNLYSTNSLDLEDSKSSLLESLTNDVNNSS